MKVTYLNHSGFIVETKSSCYIFDYFTGSINGLTDTKPVYVFSSHFHKDHYNPVIFDLLREQGITDIYGVLSWDIAPKRIPDYLEVMRVKANSKYMLPGGQSVETLHSTDEGVAFIVTDTEGIIYHAGDLNDWVWSEETKAYNNDMTKRYRAEISKLADYSINIAFLPLDPRQEKEYAQGILFFLEHVKVDKVYPMHYWKQPEVIPRFLREYPQYSSIICPTESLVLPWDAGGKL